MTNPTNKEELLARLETASTGKRKLDLDIAIRLERKLWLRARTPSTVERNGRQVVIPRYTTSLDAALALAERALPTYTATLTIYRTNSGEFRPHAIANLMCPYGEISEHHGNARTPALALCIAILRATPESPHNPGQGDGS